MQKGRVLSDDKMSVVTPEFRVSYPHVFKPSAMKGQAKAKYSITMLFDKADDLGVLKAAIHAAKIEKWGAKDKWPANLKAPVSDGDSPKNAGKDGCAGHWIAKASANEESRPGVVDERALPMADQADFYAGCYAIAAIRASAWENEFGYGVMLILDHVQKTRDGKPFGSKKSADQIFAPISGGSDSAVEDTETDFI